jgi:branched-chain amino acid transport system permease protein
MTELLQQVINGLSLGAIYALIALGYTMVYGVLRFINFAHSDVFMLGAFTAFYSSRALGRWGFAGGGFLGGLLVLAISMAACAAVGILIERLAYRPLRKRSTLTVLITAIGVSLFLQNGGQMVFGVNPKAFPNIFPSQTFKLGGLVINSNQLVVLGVALALLTALHWIVQRTRMGTAMRAVSFNATAASLVGIDTNRIISFTFGLGSALAGAGGVLYGMNYPSIEPLMGNSPGLKAFIAAVLGGIGSLPGAALGGMVLGFVETGVSGTRWSTYRDAVAFAILIGILLFRPAGLLGRNRIEKV